MQRFKTAIIYSILSLLLIGTASIAVLALNPPTQADIAPQATVTQVNTPSVDELLTLVNAERERVNVAPLIIDERLNKSAQQKADDMNVNNYYNHVDKYGRHGYDIAHEFAPDICTNPGENMNWGKETFTTAGIMESWIKSKPHYQGMTNEKSMYTGIGISGNKVVQHFC